MGKYCFSSLCCFSSSSTSKKGSGSIAESSQQPSFSPKSSQTCQDAANADLGFLQKFNDITQLNDLIHFIEELLKISSGEKSTEGSSSAVSSYIQDGQKLLQMVEENIGKLDKMRDSMAGPSAERDRLLVHKDSLDGATAEIERIVIDLLEGAAKIHWVGAALSMVGFVLERCIQTSNNKSECLEILRRMVNLGKEILQLNDQMPDQKQKLNEAVQCIVVGCTMCASQLTTTRVCRFLTASVNAESIHNFQVKIDRLYEELILWGITDMEKRMTEVASQSQEFYVYQTTVMEKRLTKIASQS